VKLLQDEQIPLLTVGHGIQLYPVQNDPILHYGVVILVELKGAAVLK